jgi:hypothetical protein
MDAEPDAKPAAHSLPATWGAVALIVFTVVVTSRMPVDGVPRYAGATAIAIALPPLIFLYGRSIWRAKESLSMVSFGLFLMAVGLVRLLFRVLF